MKEFWPILPAYERFLANPTHSYSYYFVCTHLPYFLINLFDLKDQKYKQTSNLDYSDFNQEVCHMS